jgi:lipopolysaccharide transport system ATP-binding protein
LDRIPIRTPFVMEFKYLNLKSNPHLNLSLSLFNGNEIEVFASGSTHEQVWHGRPFPVVLFRSVCHVPGDLLNDGTYRVVLCAV